MATAFEIPLSPKPQRFSISLAGTIYGILLHWCWPAQIWVLDIFDATDNLLVGGLPLVTGADLLGQLVELGIGGKLIVQGEGNPDSVPGFTTLGSNGGRLFFVTA